MFFVFALISKIVATVSDATIEVAPRQEMSTVNITGFDATAYPPSLNLTQYNFEIQYNSSLPLQFCHATVPSPNHTLATIAADKPCCAIDGHGNCLPSPGGDFYFHWIRQVSTGSTEVNALLQLTWDTSTEGHKHSSHGSVMVKNISSKHANDSDPSTTYEIYEGARDFAIDLNGE